MGLIKNYDSLAISENRKTLLSLIETGLESIQPEKSFQKSIKLEETTLSILDNTYDLSNFKNTYILAFGKGSARNAKMLEDLLREQLTDGYCIDTTEETFSKIKFTKGTHPVISQENVDFTFDVMGKLSNLTEEDLVIVIVCGGGSAMFEHPHSVSIEQKIEIEKALLKSGADITQMNVVRQHMSDVKGGGLAQILYPATISTLIFSDVPGNDIKYIASGPTVKNDTTIDDAMRLVTQFNIPDAPREIFINNPHDDKYFAKVTNTIVLSNVTVLDAIEQEAKSRGLSVTRYSDNIKGDARDVAHELVTNLTDTNLLIAAGETTVKVTGNGKGGRNQQTTLEALKLIDENVLFSSIGTDGYDFTEAAGAIADNLTKQKAQELNLSIDEHLRNNDSFTFFEKTEAQIITGRLPSNVADFMIVLKP